MGDVIFRKKLNPQPQVERLVIDRDRYKALVGSRVKSLRLERGLTQMTVANGLNVTKSSICRLENGEVDVSVVDAFILANILGSTMNDLIDVPSELILTSDDEVAYAD